MAETPQNLVSLHRAEWFWHLLAAVVSAVLLALAFPPVGWWPLAWIAFVPLVLMPTPRSLVQRFVTGYLFGYLFYALSLQWLNEVGFGAGYLLALPCALFPMLWYLLYSAWGWHFKDKKTAVFPGGGMLFFKEEPLLLLTVLFVSCEGLVRNKGLMDDMQTILRQLQSSYDYPVDVEYTINLAPDGSYRIAMLQCRPLQLTREGDAVELPTSTAGDRVLIETKGVSMGFSRRFSVDVLVYVDAIGYYEMPYLDKFKVRDALSAINWALRGQGKRLLLVTPGRICTSSPELGVPSSFSDISEFDAIFEVSEQRAGYMPELSYGSHIFQDLVEAGILYTAVFEGGSTEHFDPALLTAGENALCRYCEADAALQKIIHVREQTDGALTLSYDMASEHLIVMERG